MEKEEKEGLDRGETQQTLSQTGMKVGINSGEKGQVSSRFLNTNRK